MVARLKLKEIDGRAPSLLRINYVFNALWCNQESLAIRASARPLKCEDGLRADPRPSVISRFTDQMGVDRCWLS